jgi:Holliday junction resolvasome RuvABC endonuclease subunit
VSTIETEFDTPAITPVPVAVGARNILALDIGTQCGWALKNGDARIRSGSVSFAAKARDAAGQRWLKFTAHLSALKREVGELHAIYYEEVMAHGTRENPNVIAAHVYGGFLAQLEIFCDVNRIRLIPVSVGTIKKSFTGNGRAKKEAVIAEARRRGFRPADDNEADSLAILHFAIGKETDQ